MAEIEAAPRAQTEVALSQITNLVLQEYFHGASHPLAVHGTAVNTKEGLRLDTKGDIQNTMVVAGTEGKPGYVPVVSSGTTGDFTVTGAAASPYKVQFARSTSLFDALALRPDRFSMQMSSTTLAGAKIESYQPAQANLQVKDGSARLDDNNQYVFLSLPAGQAANCGLERLQQPALAHGANDQRVECDYLIRGLTPNTLSYNETREKFPAGHYRHSVVRDHDKVVAIVDTHFDTDSSGVMKYDVSVRPPKAPPSAK